MDATEGPARFRWPEGFREHLVAELDGFSPLVTRALADNGASVFGDGPYAHTGAWARVAASLRRFLRRR